MQVLKKFRPIWTQMEIDIGGIRIYRVSPSVIPADQVFTVWKEATDDNRKSVRKPKQKRNKKA